MPADRFTRRSALIVFVALVTWNLPGKCFGQHFKFVAFSDTQAADWSPLFNTNVMVDLAQATIREGASFVLFGGDLVNLHTPGSSAAWTNTMAPLYAAGIPIYPALGNHDKLGLDDYI